MRRSIACKKAVAAGSLVGALVLAAPAAAQDAEELRQLIELQRQQLEQQARQLEAMEQRLQELEQDAFRDQFMQGIQPPTPPVIAEGARVTSGETGLDLAISGQINRMVTLADDGDSTKLYNVDNANSSSRIRFVGRARTDAGYTVGTLLEAQLTPNASTQVSQRNQDTGNVSFEDRHVDLFFEHDDYGRVSLGKGDTAANSTAEVDLSGTTVIGYSSIADTAGGLRFYDSDSDQLTGTSIGDVFSNFDGLSRRNRLRYDTPRMAGFTLAADVISSARYSAALRWSGELPNWRMAAAAGYSYPGGDSDYIVDGSASILHQPTGLNLTLSSGLQEFDGRDDASNVYLKFGWRHDFFSFGQTAMSLDLGRTSDRAQDGDDADTVGLFAVQNIADFGIEFYGGYRFHSLDRNDADFDDIHVFAIGSRVRF
jgi:uncharacterized coiled-coil protein SlyX